MKTPVTGKTATAASGARRYGLADTGPRFALLMVVVTASSVTMLNTVIAPRPNDTPGDALGCLLAAGLDPDGRNLDNLMVSVRSSEPLLRCMSGVPAVEYWKGMVATLALLLVAAAVYWWQPRLRDRWRRTVPAEAVDTDGTLRAALTELRERAGITSGVRFRVDPARTTAGAVVYGHFGSYTVCLHAGLLVRRATDPEGFRAVVLHELAHIRNRDVDHASASTALWRVFVLLALLPYLFHEGRLFLEGLLGLTDSPFWPGAASAIGYSLLSGLLLVGLVHLARADLLRSRELHADARAVGCGALPDAWDHQDPDGAVVASVRRVTSALRTHPTWAERRRALADPTRLSGVGALAMFLIGVSASLLVNELVVVPGFSTSTGAARFTAAVVAPVLCFSLRRSVLASRVTGRTETGVRVGLWLGCGLVLGEFARGTHGNEWVGPEPQFLLGLLFAALVASVWSAQCAQLALGLSTRASRVAAGLVNLLVTAAVLWGGLHWWYETGQYEAAGMYSQAETFRDLVQKASPGPWQDYSRELSAITTALPTLTALKTSVLLEGAAFALWLFPLTLWAMAGARGLRVPGTLMAGLAGGLGCWAGLTGLGYLQHGRRPATWSARSGTYAFVDGWLAIGVLIATGLLTAAVVAAVSRRYWLPRALLAAAVAQLVGYTGAFVLYSADGCLGRFSTMADQCHWVPAAGWIFTKTIAAPSLTPAVLLAACAALGGAGAARAVRAIRRLVRRRTPPAPPDLPNPRPGLPRAARPDTPEAARPGLPKDPRPDQVPVGGEAAAPNEVPVGKEAAVVPARDEAAVGGAVPLPTPTPTPVSAPALPRWNRLLSLGTVLALSAPPLLLAASFHSGTSTSSSVAAKSGASADSVGALVDSPPTARRAKVRAWQALAWLEHGGLTHYRRIGEAVGDLGDALTAAGRQKPGANGKVSLDTKKFARLCGTLAQRADEALAYFPVPDRSAQQDWSGALAAIARNGRVCRDTMTSGHDGAYRTDADRERAFNRSLAGALKAVETLTPTLEKIEKVATGSRTKSAAPGL